jgi:hypothetical protein
LNYPKFRVQWIPRVLFDDFWLATPMELFFWWKRCWFPNTGPAVKTMVGSPGIEPGQWSNDDWMMWG